MTPDSPGSVPLLSVEGLRVDLGWPRVEAVRGIDFSIHKGEILALAGESGSGKSVTAFALTRLLPQQARPEYGGQVTLSGAADNLLALSEKRLRRIRGSGIGYIFQEPSASFNPVYTIRSHMMEILKVRGVPANRAENEIKAALEEVGILADKTHLDAWPGDFSGGMLQRAAIACALLGEPSLLIADEPTTALDASTQKRIVGLLKRLNEERAMAILFISHDLGLLKDIASRILVMKEGQIVEEGPTQEILMNPKAPYTRTLLESLPRLRL
jgi:ABC-type dipeptide/oligopeptide/nickel transport system ATPase component